MQRAYSVLDIKSVDDDLRVIEGIASTPEPDRMGDIVVPEGAKFSLPIPLLWQHRADQPIGHVVAAEVTSAGIRIRAQIAKGVLPRIDEAWTLIKHGLVRGLSIGFQALDAPEPIKGTFGVKFGSWEWLELSAVTIPANADASVQVIRSLDAPHLPALGAEASANPSGVPERPRVVKATRKDRTSVKTITEQIAAFEASRQAKSARMDEIMAAASEKGETLDQEQSDEYDGLESEVEKIDEHLRRLNARQKAMANAAKPVNGETAENAAATRSGSVITVRDNVPPGIGFARLAIAKTASYLDHRPALEVAKQYWPSDQRLHNALVQKDTITAGTTSHSTWAAPLVDQTNLAGEFIEYLRPMTILGKFGSGGVPSLRRVPFNIRVVGQNSGGTGYWVGQGAPKPVTHFEYVATTLLWTKVAAIAVITEELARFSSPSAEALVRDALAGALVERLDRDFVDPGVSEVSGVNPASITNGVTPLSSAGSSADNARTDIQNLLEQFIANNINPTGLVLIMPNTLALALSVQVNSLGQPEFPGLTMNGGSLLGIPVITSQYASDFSGGAGNLVIAVNAPDVFLADDGQVSVDVSREASLQMLSNPTNNSATGTPTTVVSMFQTNSIALRAERFVNYKKRRAAAVSYMDDVNWGAVGSPTS